MREWAGFNWPKVGTSHNDEPLGFIRGATFLDHISDSFSRTLLLDSSGRIDVHRYTIFIRHNFGIGHKIYFLLKSENEIILYSKRGCLFMNLCCISYRG